MAARLRRHGQALRAAIESMTGARFVHDQLELHGFEVEIADAAKVKGLAPLACKTDRIDAWVLAELSRRQLVPAIWLPDPTVRAERERARFRPHLVRHRSSLKHRVHATLLTHGKPCPVSDLFGARGRQLLLAGEVAVVAVDRRQAGTRVAGEFEGGDAGTQGEGRERVATGRVDIPLATGGCERDTPALLSHDRYGDGRLYR